MENHKTLVAVCCSTLVAADGLSTSYGPPAPAPAYGPPAYSPAPAVSFASAPAPGPAAVFAPAPLLVVPVLRGIHPIPVVPFPGAGRNIIHHVARGVAQALAPAAQAVSEATAAANNIVRSIATAKHEAASNIVRSIVSAKQDLLNQFAAPAIAAAPAPQTVNFSPEAYAKVAPPVGLAPPVSEYGAPAAAPAPAFAPAPQYGTPSF